MVGRLSTLGLIIEGASNDLKLVLCSYVLLEHLMVGVERRMYLGFRRSLLMDYIFYRTMIYYSVDYHYQ